MNRFIAIAAWLSFAALPLAARMPQDPPAPQRAEQVRERLEVLRDRLEMTPAQVEQVRPVLQDQAARLEALRTRSEGAGSRRSRRSMAREFREIQKATDDRLQRILSKEQMAELKELRDERRATVRERAGR